MLPQNMDGLFSSLTEGTEHKLLIMKIKIIDSIIVIFTFKVHSMYLGL